MLSIGEFAHAARMNVKTIRYYQEMEILIPAKVNQDNGYRYYDKKCFERAQSILILKELGFTIKEIRQILLECRDEEDLSLYIEEKINDIENMIQNLHKIKDQLQRQKNATLVGQEEIKEIAEYDFYLPCYVSKRIYGTYDQLGELFSSLYKQYGRFSTGKPFAFYHEFGYSEDKTDLEGGIELEFNAAKSIDSTEVFPLTKAVKLIHEGPYGTQGSSYFKLLTYCREHNYKVKLPVIEHFIKGPGMIFPGNPRHYKTECIILVEEE